MGNEIVLADSVAFIEKVPNREGLTTFVRPEENERLIDAIMVNLNPEQRSELAVNTKKELMRWLKEGNEPDDFSVAHLNGVSNRYVEKVNRCTDYRHMMTFWQRYDERENPDSPYPKFEYHSPYIEKYVNMLEPFERIKYLAWLKNEFTLDQKIFFKREEGRAYVKSKLDDLWKETNELLDVAIKAKQIQDLNKKEGTNE